jgi:putative endonuclease
MRPQFVCRVYYTYIMSNYGRNVFYVGVTSNIQARVGEHKNGEGGKFTSKYKCHYLMYFEEFDWIRDAIAREKNLKNWKREWKINLIKSKNLEFKDLSEEWLKKPVVKDPETSSG